MSNIITNHKRIPFAQLSIQDAVNKIKHDYEFAIGNGTTASTIRTGRIIKYLHEALKFEFINSNNIHPSLVNPSPKYLQQVIKGTVRRNNTQRKLADKELQLSGFLKTKKQDISIIPGNIQIFPKY